LRILNKYSEKGITEHGERILNLIK
jgi:hypothetical protein